MKKEEKQFLDFRLKNIEIEREEEKTFHCKEIYNLWPKRITKKRCILNLKAKKLAQYDDVTLIRFWSEQPFESEIKEEEIVILLNKKIYSQRKLWFEKFKKILEKQPIGTVENIWKQFIDVWVQNPVPNFIFKEKIDIHLFVNDITFKRRAEWIQLFVKSKRENLKNIIIRWILPANNLITENTPEIQVNWKYNTYQLDFIKKSNNFQNFLLLHWPFWTGKTTTLVWSILSLYNKYKLLVTADSNTAVDNILIRLANFWLKPGQVIRVWTFTKLIDSKYFDYSIFNLIEKHPKYEKIKQLENEIKKLKEKQSLFKKPVPSIRRGLSDMQIHRLAISWKTYRGLSLKILQSMSNWLLLQKQIDRLIDEKNAIKQKIIDSLIDNAQIILSTNSMTFSDILKNKTFDISIIDEWSQASLPSTLLPILLSKKFIIAWDHKQLPPTVLSEKATALKKSLFEQLISTIENKYKHLKSQYYTMLQIQYRMNKKLMDFPNQQFYNWLLKADKSVENINLTDLVWLKKWEYIITNQLMYRFNIKGKQKLDENQSLYNIEEILFLKKIVNDLISLGIKSSQIGIISPYAAQVNKLKNFLENFEDLEINTIDGFQWREKEIILISWVRTEKKWFLTDLRRINVALTRCKRMLINIGYLENLINIEIFNEYKKFLQKNWIIKNVNIGG